MVVIEILVRNHHASIFLVFTLGDLADGYCLNKAILKQPRYVHISVDSFLSPRQRLPLIMEVSATPRSPPYAISLRQQRLNSKIFPESSWTW
jgi:hypothetical protein